MGQENGKSKRPRLARFAFRTARVIGLVYLCLVLGVYFFPNGLIFFPDRHPIGDWAPPDGATDVFFRASDGTRLHGWWRKVDPKAPTFLVLHGNAGNISSRKHLIEDLGDLGANVLLFDYRGFGRSDGSPYEAGVNRDAEAAWDFLVAQNVDPDRIVLFGQSLGGAFATHLAQKRSPMALILEAPFSSPRDMAGALLPWLPLGWAVGVDMDNVARMPRIKAPVLIVHGDEDRVVPFAFGRRVFEAATSRKSFLRIPNGGHNDLWDRAKGQYVRAISNFISNTQETSSPPSPRSSWASRF